MNPPAPGLKHETGLLFQLGVAGNPPLQRLDHVVFAGQQLGPLLRVWPSQLHPHPDLMCHVGEHVGGPPRKLSEEVGPSQAIGPVVGPEQPGLAHDLIPWELSCCVGLISVSRQHLPARDSALGSWPKVRRREQVSEELHHLSIRLIVGVKHLDHVRLDALDAGWDHPSRRHHVAPFVVLRLSLDISIAVHVLVPTQEVEFQRIHGQDAALWPGLRCQLLMEGAGERLDHPFDHMGGVGIGASRVGSLHPVSAPLVTGIAGGQKLLDGCRRLHAPSLKGIRLPVAHLAQFLSRSAVALPSSHLRQRAGHVLGGEPIPLHHPLAHPFVGWAAALLACRVRIHETGNHLTEAVPPLGPVVQLEVALEDLARASLVGLAETDHGSVQSGDSQSATFSVDRALWIRHWLRSLR